MDLHPRKPCLCCWFDWQVLTKGEYFSFFFTLAIAFPHPPMRINLHVPELPERFKKLLCETVG
jgi:hypothetical protein